MSRSVALVISSLEPGGAERVVAVLTSLWAEKGWRVTVVTLSAKSSDHYSLHPRVTRIALNMIASSRGLCHALRTNWKRVAALRAALHSIRPDIVVSFVTQTNVIVLAALLATRVPVIVSERVDPRAHDIGLVWRLGRLLLYRRASAIVVQTRSVVAWARTVVPLRKIWVIPNPARKLHEPTRPRDDTIVLAAGRLEKRKGFDVLLEAFAVSRLIQRGYRLVILGEGPERGALVSLAARLGIVSAVDMPGLESSPEEWMERASVFVLPSRYEGFPNVLVEAMAMGCAVIAADCPSGPNEIIRDGEDGLLVAPEDHMALSAALKRLLEDDALRQRLGRAAVAVRHRFSPEGVLDQWETAINAAIRA
jgi:glycosyltransferase involved in cell wall biosynthesis